MSTLRLDVGRNGLKGWITDESNDASGREAHVGVEQWTLESIHRALRESVTPIPYENIMAHCWS